MIQELGIGPGKPEGPEPDDQLRPPALPYQDQRVPDSRPIGLDIRGPSEGRREAGVFPPPERQGDSDLFPHEARYASAARLGLRCKACRRALSAPWI